MFVTDIRSDAHLAIFETTDAWAATEQPIWCYTDIRSEADKSVYFTDNQWDADLVVFKTDIQPDSGRTAPSRTCCDAALGRLRGLDILPRTCYNGGREQESVHRIEDLVEKARRLK